MAKARWWLCDSCKSLNDIPATKCYKCRAMRPARPTILDDQYAQVGGPTSRVAISVDRSKISELAARDPIETEQGSGILDAFTVASAQDELPLESALTPGTHGGRPAPRPIREPVRRGIAAAGGLDWRRTLSEAPRSAAPEGSRAHTAPPPAVQGSPGGSLPERPQATMPAPGPRVPPGLRVPPGAPPPPGPPVPAMQPPPGPPQGTLPPPSTAMPPGASRPLGPPPGGPPPPVQSPLQGRPGTPGSPPMPGTPALPGAQPMPGGPTSSPPPPTPGLPDRLPPRAPKDERAG